MATIDDRRRASLRSVTRAAILGLATGALWLDLRAQTPAPAFEVASLKPNQTGERRAMMRTEAGGRFTAANVTLRDLVRAAYRLLPFQLTGEPDWVTNDRFDIVAKADGNVEEPFLADPATPSRLQLMLRTLLADRFKLAAHEDTRELPIYALTVARADRRLGPGLRPSTRDCSNSGTATADGFDCGLSIGPLKITGRNIPLSQLAGGLAGMVQRTITDRTGLSGRFDIDLAYTPELIGAADGAKVAAAGGDPNGPSIFTAIQEQLGLKLESARGPVKVLVIDSVQHPTED